MAGYQTPCSKGLTMPVLSRKIRKLFREPGPFFRDALLRRYPVTVSERIEAEPRKNSRIKETPAKTVGSSDFERWDHLDERIILGDQLSVAFPIDMVFAWVDASDPAFQAQYNKYASEAARPETSDQARFKSLDELRYALRSVFKYAPWVRKVFIVTNGQSPSWLNLENPNIQLVTHDQILQKKYLPTFNSHVIESAIHKIPGLSEHYIYFNDDMMLTRPVKREYFFSGAGLAYLFASKVRLSGSGVNAQKDTATEWGAKNARQLIKSQFNINVDQMFAHTFYPQLKSVAAKCERLWPESFHRCRLNRFRDPSDIYCTGFLFPHVAHILGYGLFTRTRLFYFNIRRREALKYYQMLAQKKGTASIVFSMCPNDRHSADGNDFPDYADHLGKCLEAFYPEPSPAEISMEGLYQSNLRAAE